MAGSSLHWQPLVNGYSDVIPQDFRDMSGELAMFPTRRGFDVLRRYQTRYILIHRHLYEQDERATREGPFPRFAVSSNRCCGTTMTGSEVVDRS